MSVQYTTRFIPGIHGFRFGNDFKHTTPISEFYTWGMCNGMSKMALDYFFAGTPIPTLSHMDYDTPILYGVGATIHGSDEQITAFRLSWDGGNRMTGKLNTGSGFGTWGECEGDHALSSPAMVSRRSNHTEISFRGTNDVIFFRGFETNVAGARKLCGNFSYYSYYDNGLAEVKSKYNPALASHTENRLDHYYVDYNGVLHYRYIDAPVSPAFNNWQSLGTPPGQIIRSGVAAASSPGSGSAFCVSNGKVWQCKKTTGSDWAWDVLSGDILFTASPAAASSAMNEIDLVCEGLDRTLYYRNFSGSTWSESWENVGTPLGGLKRNCTPALINKASSTILYALGSDGKLWRTTRTMRPSSATAVWSAWQLEEVPYDPIMLPLKAAVAERNMETVKPYVALIVAGVVITGVSALAGAATGAVLGAGIGAGVFGLFGAIVGGIIGGLIGLVAGAVAGAAISTIPLIVWLPAAGTARNYLTWRVPGYDTTFRWSSTDELKKLVEILMRGQPISLGLMQFDGFGHEVVACGIESDIPMPVNEYQTYPADYAWRIKVYDPTHPGCDSVTITIDPHSTMLDNGNPKKIYSSTGENWKGLFVRDDYERKPPPRL